VLHDVSCSLGCLTELSNDNNQPSTTRYALSRHDCFNVLTNIDLFTFISDTNACLCLGLEV